MVHPCLAARLAAAWCLRCICVAVPSQITPLIDRCISGIEDLRTSPEAISGMNLCFFNKQKYFVSRYDGTSSRTYPLICTFKKCRVVSIKTELNCYFIRTFRVIPLQENTVTAELLLLSVELFRGQQKRSSIVK